MKLENATKIQKRTKEKPSLKIRFGKINEFPNLKICDLISVRTRIAYNDNILEIQIFYNLFLKRFTYAQNFD